MKLQNVYHTLQIFVQWIEDGYYDFQSLPYATKSHLHEEDEQVLWQLQQHYTGTSKWACNNDYYMQKFVPIQWYVFNITVVLNKLG